MVQGPYGPLAEYQSPFLSGAPTYQSFQSPTFPGLVGAPAPGPAPAPAERTAASKVAEYRQWASYGLSDDRIRRIAEVIYGPQTDAAWAELRRMAGADTGGVRSTGTTGTTGTARTTGTTGTTGTARTARTTGTTGDVGVDAGRGGIGYGAPANPAFFSQQPSFTRLSKTSTPSQISAAYDEFVASRGGDTEANRAEALKFLQSKGISQPKINDAYSKFQKGETVAEITGLSQKDWEKEATFAARETPGSRTLGIWRDPTSGKGIAVTADSRGQPANFTYISEEGIAGNSSIFHPRDLYENANKWGIDLSNIWQLGDLLDEKKVKYKPYELYQGTGSDHGINFYDIAQGGLGTAYDWTKDPLVHLKGESGATSLANAQALASRLGVKKNPFVTTERGIDPSRFTTLGAERGDPRSNVAFTGGTASWYRTPQEAQNYLNRIGGGVLYDTRVGGTRGPNPFVLNTSGLDLKSSTGIANAYDQFLATQQGGDTAASRAQAQNFLQAQGVQQPLINQAYDVYKNDLMDPKGIASKYNEFISSRGGDTEANRAEALQYLQGQGIAQPMINQAYDVFKQGNFAHGGAVQMEDGGFVMTKRAVDGAGGPQGIQQLVPGARMIRGPGHGTSDSIPAVINGRNGQTPARLSNGEAYVPPGRNTKGLYALMHQLERKA
jgi:pimeloyl-CoA synthetase